jgi:small-conductance mechanosensitive channel/CRP-like cAMP-binding protein
MAPLEKLLFVGPENFRIALGFAAAVLVIALFKRTERRHVLRATVLFGLSILVRLIAAALERAGMPDSASNVSLVSVLLQGIAFVMLAAVLLFGILLPAARLDMARLLRDLFVALGSLALFLYLLSVRHVDLMGLVATSAVLTAVIGFSLQDTLANVMGGVALQLDGSFRVGDWLRFGDTSGRLREINWRHTALETRNGDTLVVPNSLLMKTAVLMEGKRLDQPVQQRRWVTFSVDYRHAPTEVADTVLAALRREPIPNVSQSPLPDCVLMAFRDSWADYAVRYWLTDLFLNDPTDSVIRTRVFFALKRAGIPLSMPAQSIFLTEEDEQRRRHVSEREETARLKALQGVPLFAPLNDEERSRLAANLTFAPFAPAEAMIVQGKAVHHLYILTRGSAEVRISVEGAPARHVATLYAPDFFGEMGMLTGEPRRATVVALTDVECWRLTKERFQEILQARPALAKDISRILAERDVELAAIKENLSEEAKQQRLLHAHGSLLAKIQDFFGIE